MNDITHIVFDSPGLKHSHFWKSGSDYIHGLVYDAYVGIEFDVRETDTGWNVNDDEGRNFHFATLAIALREARKANL